MNACLRPFATLLIAGCTLPLAAHAGDAPAQDASVQVAAAAPVASTCAADAALTPLQRRLIAKYDRDVTDLMRFVWNTRNIYLLDRMETALWAENYRNANAPCPMVTAAAR